MAHEEYTRIIPGSDTAVLMIHGICGTPDHFRELRTVIPAGWSVHCLLLDGHGGKVEDFSASSMKKWKSQVFSCLDELLATHNRVILVGHSMGTLFSIQAAIRYPDRIPFLFLLGSPLRVFVTPATAVNAVKLSFGFVDENDRSAVDMRRGLSIQVDACLPKYIFWIPRFLELFKEIWDTRRLLPRLAVPTQVFQSKQDELVHPSSCDDFQGHPYIQCTLLPDSGHFGYGDADMKLLKESLGVLISQIQ